VLRRYGFRDTFLDWLAILFFSASSRVLINGSPAPPSGISAACARTTRSRRSSSSSPWTR
jgi:hypothetical protein